MASVSYKNVTKKFGDVIALNNFDIHVKDKEFLVLVGPSGCGKSTALRLLAGLEDLTAGTIMIGDKEVNELPPKDRDIAMVFQSYALYPHMSVFENMAFGLRLRKMDKAEIIKRVDSAASILGIETLLDRKPRQLSGGQRQRVAVGRAIVREPNVFLLDEPLSNLDAKLRVQTRAEISKLHKELATTFIYVTHDQVEAMTMATRIAVMNFGELQQIDSPQKLYDQPANKFVAGFIGSPSMNFFDAKITKAGAGLKIITTSFQVKVPKSLQKAYTKYLDKSVVFGIRPEDIHDSGYTPANIAPAKVNAKVEVIELMGNEIVSYLKSGENTYVARVDPRSSYTVGDEVQVIFNADNIHVFDKDTELAVR